ncbi:MAG TPA: FAD:protein FMN transferase, partial [Streptosporangiaceae bacterium]
MSDGRAGGQDGPVPARPALLTHAEPAMGTVFSFALVPGALRGAELRSALTAACACLHEADATFSTWDPDSPVSRFRRGEADLAGLPGEVAEVLAACQHARQASGGWFDPWAMPGGFDPTGLVKGWAVDRALGLLRQAGLPGAMVNGGGDLAVFGRPAP